MGGIKDFFWNGIGKTIGRAGWPMLQGIGNAAIGTTKAGGRAIKNTAIAIGTPIAESFETPEARRAVVSSWGNLLKDAGNTFVKLDKNDMPTFTGKGMLLVGGAMTYDKLRDTYSEEKAARMGTIDRKPTTATPSFQPQQYERHPPKRITYDSGGATGDLVFALRALR